MAQLYFWRNFQSDIRTFDDLSEADKVLIQDVVRWPGQSDDNEQETSMMDLGEESDRPWFIQMSTVNETGVMKVRSVACDQLLAMRVQAKLRAAAVVGEANAAGDIANRLYVATPKTKSDGISNEVRHLLSGFIFFWCWPQFLKM